MLNREESMTKRARFYTNFKQREFSNMSFMQKCRFYWSEAEPSELATFVYPNIEDLNNINNQPRIIIMPKLYPKEELRILKLIIEKAKGMLDKYQTAQQMNI